MMMMHPEGSNAFFLANYYFNIGTLRVTTVIDLSKAFRA